jgi:hypothetical protein
MSGIKIIGIIGVFFKRASWWCNELETMPERGKYQ